MLCSRGIESLHFCRNRIILSNRRGVAQLAAHCVWDAGVGGSSPPTPTKARLNRHWKPHDQVEHQRMAKKKYDGVIEAVHYQPDGQVDWVRAYLRRGPTWSDCVLVKRQDLINEIKAGRVMMVGQRVQYMAGTFEVSDPVKLVGSSGSEVLVTTQDSADQDQLKGVPVI
jgi:hypothetical protein